MTKQINSPMASKINWTVGVAAAVNVGVYYAVDLGHIPADALADVLVVGNLAAQALIAVFRTWFTG
jgi:hypothetical protein